MHFYTSYSYIYINIHFIYINPLHSVYNNIYTVVKHPSISNTNYSDKKILKT